MKVRFIVYKTIMLGVIFQHDFSTDNIYFPIFYTIKIGRQHSSQEIFFFNLKEKMGDEDEFLIYGLVNK